MLFNSLSLLATLPILPYLVVGSPTIQHIRDAKPEDIQLAPRQSCENSATDRGCWGEYNIDTNYYDTFPVTGVTREYWLELVNVTLAPDGVERTVLTVNGTMPGPTLYADWGDTVVVHVTNSLQNNGSSIHFHGLRQLNTVQNDGVVSVTQCPSAPGTTYTYTWNVTQYGTSWYHSHYSLQAWDGVFGGIILNGPTTANYDEDQGLLIIQDWDHKTASALFDYAKYVGKPTLDTGLINGKNMWEGAGSYFETTFVKGTTYKFHLVNGAIDSYFKFGIDNHTLTVTAIDFVPVVPFETDYIPIGIGQRYDFIVTANDPGDLGNYWMRAIIQDACSFNTNPDGVLGIVRYDSSSTADPTSIAVNTTDTCDEFPISSLVPWLPLNAGSADQTEDLEVIVGADTANSSIIYWYVGGSSLDLDWQNPTLLEVQNGVTTFSTQQNLYKTSTGEWTYLILEQTSGAAHPIHLHGHDFYLLAQGSNSTYAEANPTLNLTNPPRRDVALLPPEGYLVFAFLADNPGAWVTHCHIGWHQDLGLALQFLEEESAVGALIDKTVMNSTCAAWDAYQNGVKLVQDDDGI